MPKKNNIAARCTAFGLAVILSMFVNIVGHINSQSDINNSDVHVISAFAG